eukprot:2021614-Pyramimonas_sp.AAC.1
MRTTTSGSSTTRSCAWQQSTRPRPSRSSRWVTAGSYGGLEGARGLSGWRLTVKKAILLTHCGSEYTETPVKTTLGC